MAGTLTISTLSDGTNSTSSTNCIQGSAKAWVNFNGVSGASIRGSYNVSSITRTSTGYYTINFTNALSNINYAVSGLTNGNTGSGSCKVNAFVGANFGTTVAPTTSAFTIVTSSTGDVYYESTYVLVTVNGN